MTHVDDRHLVVSVANRNLLAAASIKSATIPSAPVKIATKCGVPTRYLGTWVPVGKLLSQCGYAGGDHLSDSLGQHRHR